MENVRIEKIMSALNAEKFVTKKITSDEIICTGTTFELRGQTYSIYNEVEVNQMLKDYVLENFEVHEEFEEDFKNSPDYALSGYITPECEGEYLSIDGESHYLDNGEFLFQIK